MASIKGYIFNTEEQANKAMELLNKYHGLPVEGGTTIFNESSYQQFDEGFYIAYDAEWTAILGKPADIVLPKIKLPI
jgi:hypothetical protein